MKTFFSVLAAIAAVVAVLWLSTAVGLTHFKFWAPKYEEARREVFVNTPSYVQGKNQFLTRLHHEWQTGDPAHKAVVCATARHEAATIDPEHLQPALRAWECTK